MSDKEEQAESLASVRLRQVAELELLGFWGIEVGNRVTCCPSMVLLVVGSQLSPGLVALKQRRVFVVGSNTLKPAAVKAAQ